MKTDNEWRIELLQAKSGMPKRFAYISEIREMHPDLGKKKVAHLHRVWNGRAIKEPSHSDPYWGVKLLINLCNTIKENWK